MNPKYQLVIRGGAIVDGTGCAPYTADVAIRDGVIVEIGEVAGAGSEEILAHGLVVTPGFVDVHTHYDGQITWEHQLAPSSQHGVTTVVMGNCGVGFAPVWDEDREIMIGLMEGVEDIPAVVMAEGVPFNWNRFPEYLDAIEQRATDVDFAAQIPHSPLRVYVMRKRGADLEAPTHEDLAEMRRLVAEAIGAGALGVTTSRNLFHRFRSGALSPCVATEIDELLALGSGLKDAGGGVFQINPNIDAAAEGEFAVVEAVARQIGRPVTFSLMFTAARPENWPFLVNSLRKARGDGLTINAQFFPRPMGVLYGLDLTFHPFSLCPSYRPIADLTLAEKVQRMHNPVLRARLLSEEPEDINPASVQLLKSLPYLYKLGDPADYDFAQEDGLRERAAREGRTLNEVIYDALLEDGGNAIICAYSSEAAPHRARTAELIGEDNMIVSLGDGGAHYGTICDAPYTTHMLANRLGRDGLDLPTVIKVLTSQPAQSIGLCDRGAIAVGYKADINIIDVDGVVLRRPRVEHDLPAGGKRLCQDAKGYAATIVSGVVTYRGGVPTGALPGRLVRGARKAPNSTTHTGSHRDDLSRRPAGRS